MMEQIQALKARFDELEQREQYILMAAAVAITLFLFMTIIYRPLSSSLAAERADYYAEVELRDWMQVQVNQLKSQSSQSASTSNRGQLDAETSSSNGRCTLPSPDSATHVPIPGR